MHSYLFETELVRFAFILGVIVSIFAYDRLHLTTGSVIVPGYIGVFILQPVTIASTFANALLVFAIVYHVLPRYTLIYGRSRFFALIPFSILFQIALLSISSEAEDLWQKTPFLAGIGYIVPALIAHDMGRQGVSDTVANVLGTGLLVALIVLGVAAIFPAVLLETEQPIYASLAFDLKWMPFAVLFSAMASSALTQTYGFRAGGFVGGAYVSLISGNILQLLYIGLIALATYVVVVRVLMKTMILFGRRKFATMLLVGSLMAWGSLLFGELVLGREELAFSSLPLTGVVLAGLLANDVERVGPLRLLQGLALSVSFTLSATLLLAELAGDRRSDVYEPLALLTLVIGALVFGRYAQAVVDAIREPGEGEPRLARLWGALNQRHAERIILPSELPGASNMIDPAMLAGEDPLSHS